MCYLLNSPAAGRGNVAPDKGPIAVDEATAGATVAAGMLLETADMPVLLVLDENLPAGNGLRTGNPPGLGTV